MGSWGWAPACLWWEHSCSPWTQSTGLPPETVGFSRQEYWSGVPLPSPISSWNATLRSLSSLERNVKSRTKA